MFNLTILTVLCAGAFSALAHADTLEVFTNRAAFHAAALAAEPSDAILHGFKNITTQSYLYNLDSAYFPAAENDGYGVLKHNIWNGQFISGHFGQFDAFHFGGAGAYAFGGNFQDILPPPNGSFPPPHLGEVSVTVSGLPTSPIGLPDQTDQSPVSKQGFFGIVDLTGPFEQLNIFDFQGNGGGIYGQDNTYTVSKVEWQDPPADISKSAITPEPSSLLLMLFGSALLLTGVWRKRVQTFATVGLKESSM